MPLADLSQWHALLLSAALIWAGVPPTVRVQAPPEVNEAFAAALADASADDKPFAPFLNALEGFGGCHAWSSAFEAAGFTAVSLDSDYVTALDLSQQLVLAVAFALHLRVAGVALLAVPCRSLIRTSQGKYHRTRDNPLGCEKATEHNILAYLRS